MTQESYFRIRIASLFIHTATIPLSSKCSSWKLHACYMLGVGEKHLQSFYYKYTTHWALTSYNSKANCMMFKKTYSNCWSIFPFSTFIYLEKYWWKIVNCSTQGTPEDNILVCDTEVRNLHMNKKSGNSTIDSLTQQREEKKEVHYVYI